MNDISFTEALGIVPGITAIIGGGGKTSLMNRLAAELSAAGSRVIICTSTHIWRPADLPVLENAAEADIAAALMEHSVVCVGEREGEKLIAPKLPIARLNGLAPYVIAEADGSKGLPFKASTPRPGCSRCRPSAYLYRRNPPSMMGPCWPCA